MDVREKLMELLREVQYLGGLEEKIADHLITHGVIVPPCEVGDTVYRVMADKRIKHPYEYKVTGFWCSAYEACNNLHLVRHVNGVFESSISVPFTEFNRALFLTKEEAERALKGRENGEC